MSEIAGEKLKVTRGWATFRSSLNGGEPHSNKSDSYRTMGPERKRSIKRQGKTSFEGKMILRYLYLATIPDRILPEPRGRMAHPLATDADSPITSIWPRDRI
jgi:hypothetical protein